MLKNKIIGSVFAFSVLASLISVAPSIVQADADWYGSWAKEVTRVSPFIRVVTPNGGKYAIGQISPLNVTWQGLNLSGNTVDISIVNTLTGISYGLSTSTPNSGSASLVVPANVPGGKYTLKIKTSSSTISSAEGVSKNSIQISAANISRSFGVVNQPQALIATGGVASTSWTITGNIPKVNVYMVSSSDASTLIAKNLNNTGSYSYTIPATQPTGSYFLKIVDSASSTVSATTTNFIVGLQSIVFDTQPTNVSLDDLNRKGVVSVIAGWKTDGIVSKVSVGIEGAETKVLAPNVSNVKGTNTYTWNVRVGQLPGTYRFVVKSVGIANSVIATSSSFTIGTARSVQGVNVSPSSVMRYESANIKWVASSPTAKLKFDLLKNGTLVRTIANNVLVTSVDKGVDFKMNDAEGDYVIKASDVSNANIFATTSFAVKSAIISNVSSDKVSVGTGKSITVSWNNQGTIGSYDVKLTATSTGSTTLLKSGVTAKSFTWTVPAGQEVGGYKFSVNDHSNPNTVSTSSEFTITTDRGIASVGVGSGSPFTQGQTLPIVWSANASVSNVKVELYKGSSLVATVASSIAAKTGSKGYVIPLTTATGTDYTVKVTDTQSSATLSSSQFEIRKKSMGTITLSASSVSLSSQITATWNTENVSKFKLQIIDVLTGLPVVTAGSVTAKSYNWSVPQTQKIGNYKFVVSDYNDTDNSVTSNAFGVTTSISVTSVVASLTTGGSAISSIARGGQFSLSYSASNVPASDLKVYLIKKDDYSSKVLLTKSSSSGKYTVPSTSAGKYYLSVEWKSNSSVRGVSSDFDVVDTVTAGVNNSDSLAATIQALQTLLNSLSR